MTRFPRWPLIKFLSERKSFISRTAEYCQPRCNFSEMWSVHTTRYSVIFQKFPSRVRVVQKKSEFDSSCGYSLDPVGYVRMKCRRFSSSSVLLGTFAKAIHPKNCWFYFVVSLLLVALPALSSIHILFVGHWLTNSVVWQSSRRRLGVTANVGWTWK